MTATNTLYRLTTRTPYSDLNPKIVWPGGSRPTKYGQNDQDAVTVHYGFGGAVHAEDLGPYGTMVYGGTGEDTFAQQLSSLTLDEDNPEWEMFQQPFFCLSDAEAITEDADWFYDPTTASGLATNRKMDNNYLIPNDWDGAFPISISTQGWVLRRKAKMTMGRNQPHIFRYNMPCWIPASMTGTGSGAILVNTDAFAGPYRGNNGKPANVGMSETFTPTQYCADVFGDGTQKNFVFAMNTSTKAWTRLDAAPVPSLSGGEITRSHSFVDRTGKRVYYKIGEYIYYLDFTGGISGVTISTPELCTLVGTPIAVDYDAGAAMCEGHPTRRLMYLKGRGGTSAAMNSLQLIDLDNAEIHQLYLEGYGLDFNSRNDIGFGYDAANNRVLMTWRTGAGAMKLGQFVVPSDPTTASNYTVTTTTLSLASGVTIESGMTFQCRFSDHGVYHPLLNVILWQQNQEAPLAFIPA
jgi:hypothetical protein